MSERHGVELPADLQVQLRTALKEKNEEELGAELGLSWYSVLRAAAGCRVRKGTSKVIELGLESRKGGA